MNSPRPRFPLLVRIMRIALLALFFTASPLAAAPDFDKEVAALLASRCIECHSGVHGSNHNKGLLDPDLGSKIDVGPAGCFCHDVEG